MKRCRFVWWNTNDDFFYVSHLWLTCAVNFYSSHWAKQSMNYLLGRESIVMIWLTHYLWTADNPALFFTYCSYNFTLGTHFPSQRKHYQDGHWKGIQKIFLLDLKNSNKEIWSSKLFWTIFIFWSPPMPPPLTITEALRTKNQSCSESRILFLDIYFNIWLIECCTPLRIAE